MIADVVRGGVGVTHSASETQDMLSLKRKSKTAASTPFWEFIRNASSAEKKRVYQRVLEKASGSQNQVLIKTAKIVQSK